MSVRIIWIFRTVGYIKIILTEYIVKKDPTLLKKQSGDLSLFGVPCLNELALLSAFPFFYNGQQNFFCGIAADYSAAGCITFRYSSGERPVLFLKRAANLPPW